VKIASITLFLLLFMGCFSYISAFDIRSPEIFIQSPTEGAYLSGETLFETKVHTYQPIYEVTIYFNETSWQEIDQTSGSNQEGVFVYKWQTQDVPDGSYNVTIKAIDAYGKSNIHNINVIIDNTKPMLQLIEPDPILFSMELSGEQLLRVKAIDFGSSVASVQYRIDETSWNFLKYRDNEYQATYPPAATLS
jgi:hypothetical protein